MKIIIEELPVNLIDRNWVEPLYAVELEEPEKLIVNQGLRGLEAKSVIKLVKKILKEKQRRRIAGHGPRAPRPKPKPRPCKKCC